MEFPETVVLSISTHGIVIKDKPSMTIPRGMQFAKMSWVMPTVCSFMGDSDVASANKIIMSNVLDRRHVITSENLQERCEDITKQLSGILKESVSINRAVIKDVETGRDTDEFFEHRKAYIRSANRGLRVFSTLTGTKTFINKAYVRDRTEAINPDGDWQIRALNMPGQPDVVNFVEGRAHNTRGESETDLKEIIRVLKDNGVKNVMMFDFSCANVTDESREDILTSSRQLRAFARDAIHASTTGSPVPVSKLGVSLRSSSKNPRKNKSNKHPVLKTTGFGGKKTRRVMKRSNRR